VKRAFRQSGEALLTRQIEINAVSA
jgi:hypothetical protein